jgi:predicted RecA/RadA family phage recombinase
MVGLSGGRVDTAASFSGVRTGAARVEAEALARETADTELKAWLDKAGVTQKEGVYSLPDGKTITAESGKSIAWTITEEVHDDRVVVTAEPKLVSVQK